MTEKAQCSVCLAEHVLRKDGTVRHHLGDISIGGWRQVCAGVGKPPAVMQRPDYADLREEP